MIFKDNVYLVILDGEYIGLTEDYDEISEMAFDHTNGTRHPLYDDDMPDRLWWKIININRFIKDGKNVFDKFENESGLFYDSWLCYDEHTAERLVDKLNKLELYKERFEAKIRAENL